MGLGLMVGLVVDPRAMGLGVKSQKCPQFAR